jgi:predicted nucleic acid-binding protein
MVAAVFDTNILIDYSKGYQQARAELLRYEHPCVSLVTWMELLAGAGPEEEPHVRTFLERLDVLPIDQAVAERAVQNRRQMRIRLPDAVIFATAQVHGMILVTRNTRDFDENHPSIRVPYRI